MPSFQHLTAVEVKNASDVAKAEVKAELESKTRAAAWKHKCTVDNYTDEMDEKIKKMENELCAERDKVDRAHALQSKGIGNCRKRVEDAKESWDRSVKDALADKDKSVAKVNFDEKQELQDVERKLADR